MAAFLLMILEKQMAQQNKAQPLEGFSSPSDTSSPDILAMKQTASGGKVFSNLVRVIARKILLGYRDLPLHK